MKLALPSPLPDNTAARLRASMSTAALLRTYVLIARMLRNSELRTGISKKEDGENLVSVQSIAPLAPTNII